jgi:hypothetical protein
METICNNASQFIGKTLIFAIKDFPPNSAWERIFDFNNGTTGKNLYGTRNAFGSNMLLVSFNNGGYTNITSASITDTTANFIQAVYFESSTTLKVYFFKDNGGSLIQINPTSGNVINMGDNTFLTNNTQLNIIKSAYNDAANGGYYYKITLCDGDITLKSDYLTKLNGLFTSTNNVYTSSTYTFKSTDPIFYSVKMDIVGSSFINNYSTTPSYFLAYNTTNGVNGGSSLASNAASTTYGVIKSFVSPLATNLGRYIRLEKTNILNTGSINIVEIEAYDSTGTKIIPVGASASSTLENNLSRFGPAFLYDNIKSSSIQGLVHTTSGNVGEYVQMDLGVEKEIKTIIVYNRIDGFQDRIQGCTVKILNASNVTVYSAPEITTTALTYTFTIPGEPIAPITSVSVDISNVSVNVYNNPLNPTTKLSVIGSGGSGIYTYTWSGVVASTSSANIPYKSSPSSEIITVMVSDGFTNATKTFNITYVVPEVVNPVTSAVPAPGVIQKTETGAVVVAASTGLGTLITDKVVLSSYVEPSGANIAKLVGNVTTTTAGNYTNIIFNIDKYTASNVKVESDLASPSTFGTILFDISAASGFNVLWKNPLTSDSIKTAQFDGTNTSVNYSGVVLTKLSTTSSRNYFRYIGPNSDTIIVTYSTTIAPPCFVAGTRILTPTGEKLVEDLRSGDIVLTADGRKLPATIYSTKISKTTNNNAPYLIKAGAFGSTPSKDLYVSGKHAIQSKKDIWQIPEFSSSAKQVMIGSPVEYYHIELPNYFTDNLIANGIVAESLANNQIDRTKSIYIYNNKRGGFIRNMNNITASIIKH